MSPQQALDLSNDPEVVVIDVRTPEEFDEGHIDGAEMIDFYADTFGDDIAALDQDETYLLYCRSGNRSGQTAALMAQLGFDSVYDMDGGVLAYSAEGLPLVRWPAGDGAHTRSRLRVELGRRWSRLLRIGHEFPAPQRPAT